MNTEFDAYLLKLRETPIGEHTEHTGRSALEALLNEFAGGGITVQHEPKREPGKGAPDFKVKRQGMILGYVEVKTFDANLDDVRNSEQIKRYRELSSNILLTNYREFMWLDGAGVRDHATVVYPHELEGRTLRIPPERAEAAGKLIAGFFSVAPQGIGRSKELALALAARSRLLREALGHELVRQDTEHRE